MAVHNADIANLFNRFADLLEIEGANAFRVRAYRTAAQTIEDLPRSAGDPFLNLYTSIIDLDAKFPLGNTESVFHECLLREGAFHFRGERVDLESVQHIALLMVEVEYDDIAAPGQTSAVHELCRPLPDAPAAAGGAWLTTFFAPSRRDMAQRGAAGDPGFLQPSRRASGWRRKSNTILQPLAH